MPQMLQHLSQLKVVMMFGLEIPEVTSTAKSTLSIQLATKNSGNLTGKIWEKEMIPQLLIISLPLQALTRLPILLILKELLKCFMD